MAQKDNKNYLLPIIMMVLLFGMISFVTNLAAPMGKILINQFGVSNALGLFGNLANFIAYAVMGIPGGMLLQRYGYKKTA
ncbi:MAG: MFS transporter, partial [Tannerella sp.]|nr:MFS transporter [Tannerella sp.]